MNIWHDIGEDRIYPTDFISVIEISKGSNKKHELDKETGMLSLDRILFAATHYPMEMLSLNNYVSYVLLLLYILLQRTGCHDQSE